MKQNQSSSLAKFLAVSFALASLLQSAQAATVYWDTNGATGGSSAGTTANGTWNMTTTGNWTTDSTGASATTNYTTASGGSPSTADVIFSAGLNATGSSAITLDAANATTGIFANSITIEDGAITTATTNTGNLGSNPLLTLGSGGLTIAATAAGNSSFNGNTSVGLSASQSWTNNLSGSTFTAGGTVFSVAASGTQTLTTGGVGSFTFSSVISNGTTGGTVALTKNGAGTLTLNTNNTYSGATIVNGGTLALGSNTGGPFTIANSDVTVNSGGTFTFGGDTDTRNQTWTIAKSLTLNSGTAKLIGTFRSPTDVFTNDLTLASGANLLAVDGAQNGGFGSAVKFNGTLARSAGATILFRGKNLGGSTTIDANNTNQPQDIYFATAPTLVGGGGAMNTTTTSIISYAIGDNGYLQGSLYLTSGLGTDFVSYNPTGGTGAGVQLLTTYATTITNGSSVLNNVKVTDASATGINAATTINSLILNSATASAGSPGTTSVDGSGTLTINSGALMVTTTSAAASNGGTGGNYGGLFQNNATIGASGLTLDFGSSEAIITTVGSSTLTIASTSGGITGTGGLTKSGAGNLNLNAADAFTGTTTINAGQIVLGNANALQNSALNYNNQGGTLSFGSLTAATLGGLTGAQNLALTNASAANVALTVGGTNNLSSSYSGALTGGGSLTKDGTGTFTLTGSNSYTGNTTISNGTLQAGVANAIPSGSGKGNVVINGGASTAGIFDINGFDVGINGLSGTSNTVLGKVVNNATGTNKTLTVGNNNATATFAGVIADHTSGTGTVALTKAGSGTQTLSGSNTYTGTTTISNGTLKINGLHSGAGAYEVQSGGTLGGSGTITTAGNAGITLDAGGKLSPGNSPGTLTADLGSGVFDISAGVNDPNTQSLLFDLTTTSASDRVLLSNASSTFNIGTGVLEFDDFVFTTGAGFGVGTYTLFDSSNAITGTLGGSLSGIVAGYNATISFTNANQDIILTVTAVPEPATYGALAGLALTGLSLTSVIRRRGKRANS